MHLKPIYIFEGIEDYLLASDKNSWQWNRIIQGINILQDKTLHIFVLGTEGYGQAETLKLLAPSSFPPSIGTFNYEFKPQIYYKNAHICLWESPGLGRLDCSHKDLVNNIVSVIRDTISTNLFVLLFILNIKRFGLSYEEDFINQLRYVQIKNRSDLDSHIIIALNTADTKDTTLCNQFISKTSEILHNNLSLDSKIIPFCPEDEQSSLNLKAKLLIRSAALYHKYA